MNSKIVIIGAGGHGRVAADIAKKNGYSEIVFLDDDEHNHLAKGKINEITSYVKRYDFFVAIGDNEMREKMSERVIEGGGNIVSLIHPSAVIGDNVVLGRGVVVMAGVVLNTGARIGDGCIVNTAASIDHDCDVGMFSHVSVGAHLAGTVHVGARTFIGAGATVINNISVVQDCTIGAGAVVLKNIESKGTYVGVPAKRIK